MKSDYPLVQLTQTLKKLGMLSFQALLYIGAITFLLLYNLHDCIP